MEDYLFITKTLIDSQETPELDLDFQDKIGLDYEKHPGGIETIHYPGYPSIDNEPVEIEYLLKMLKDFRDGGATHVAFDYNTDHLSYEIEAYEIRLSTEREIRTHEEEIQKTGEAERQREIERLQKQIDKLKKGEI